MYDFGPFTKVAAEGRATGLRDCVDRGFTLLRLDRPGGYSPFFTTDFEPGRKGGDGGARRYGIGAFLANFLPLAPPTLGGARRRWLRGALLDVGISAPFAYCF